MKISKIVSAIMAVLLLVASATVAANAEVKEMPERAIPERQGTYNGYTYTLSATQASSQLIKSTGTYSTSAMMKLKFAPTFSYVNTTGGISNVQYSSADALDFGTSYCDSLTKSYTVSQAAAKLYTLVGSTMVRLDLFLPAGSYFSKCVYKLNIAYTDVCSFAVNYTK